MYRNTIETRPSIQKIKANTSALISESNKRNPRKKKKKNPSTSTGHISHTSEASQSTNDELLSLEIPQLNIALESISAKTGDQSIDISPPKSAEQMLRELAEPDLNDSNHDSVNSTLKRVKRRRKRHY